MWFDAVKPYPVNGWALAGHVGQMGGIYRILRRLLLLRDLKMLGGDYELVHILRLSRLRWAPVVTAVQQAVRETTNSPSFRITFDSSSPYRVAGVTTQYMVTAPLGDKLKGWTMAAPCCRWRLWDVNAAAIIDDIGNKNGDKSATFVHALCFRYDNTPVPSRCSKL